MYNSNAGFKNPNLQWVIEPENKIRFRYESEGGSHGGLTGKYGKKTHPTLKLINYHRRKPVFVRVSLYTEDEKEHVLEFKRKKSEGSKPYIEEKLQDDNTVVFKNLQILSKKKDEIERILMERKLKNLKDDMTRVVRAQFEKSYSKDVKARARSILNSVRLYFEAFESDRPNIPICTLFSDVICNQKAASKGDLRIVRLSQIAGSWRGGDEMILLCDKVQKDNIKVKFFETNEYCDVIWEDYGIFSPVDVHYQVAITFKTPPYSKNEETTVFICLERNGETSEPRTFTYKSEPEESSCKRRKLDIRHSESVSSSSFVESTDSSSSMSVSSPECASNGAYNGIQTTCLLTSDDSNQLEKNDITNIFLSDEHSMDNCISFFNSIIGNDGDFDLPFEPIFPVENVDDGSDGFYTPTFMDQSRNERIHMDNVPNRSLADTVDGAVCDHLISNQKLDLIAGLRNLELAESKSSRKCSCQKVSTGKESEHSSDLQHKKEISSRLLLKKDKNGNTLLHTAVLLNKNIIPILKICRLVNINLIDERNHKNQTALHLAVEGNRSDVVKTLLRCAGNPNLKDCNGNNCYHIASRNNFPSILQELNQFSRFPREVGVFNDEGLTPVHLAIKQKKPQLFDLLKIHISDPNILEMKAGKSLLHYAVDFQPSLLPKLLDMANIDVDVQDFDGNTPLHIACANNNLEAVWKLLQSQADPTIKNFKQDFNSLDLESSDDASEGQLPADLTTKLEILNLLRAATATQITVENSVIVVNPGHTRRLDGPCRITQKLCSYLDEDMKWKKLATFFVDENFVESLSLGSTPATALLDYIKKEEQDNFKERLKNALEFAGLQDAINIVNEI